MSGYPYAQSNNYVELDLHLDWRPFRKILTSGLGLDDMSGLVRRGSTIGFHLLWHTVELAMSTRLCLSPWLIWFLCFRFDALIEFGAFMRTDFLCISY